MIRLSILFNDEDLSMGKDVKKPAKGSSNANRNNAANSTSTSNETATGSAATTATGEH